MKPSIISVVFIIFPAIAFAGDSFQASGFISQSIVKTSHGVKLSGNSDGRYGSIERTEVGGQAAYELNDHVDFRGMISFMKDGPGTDQPRVNYALMDLHTPSGLHGVRVGRYSYDYGFYNAARNNPVYRDMELPPQGLYRDGFKVMTRSGDGVQVYTKNHLTENYSIEFELGVGVPVLYPQQEIAQTMVMDKGAGEFTDKSKFTSFNAILDNREYGWTLKYEYLLMNYRFSTPYVDNGSPFPMRPKNHYLGFRKYFTFGDITLEGMQTYMGTTKWDSVNPLPNYTWGGVQGWSITYKHYVTETLSAIIGYDTWSVNKADPTGEKIEAASYGTIPHAVMYHNSWNFGLVQRTGPYTLRGEVHLVKGSNTMQASGNNILSTSQPDNYNVFILSATYKF